MGPGDPDQSQRVLLLHLGGHAIVEARSDRQRHLDERPDPGDRAGQLHGGGRRLYHGPTDQRQRRCIHVRFLGEPIVRQ